MTNAKHANVHLSAMQYNMLKIILSKRVFSQQDAAQYLQGTFSSMAHARRAYIATHLDPKTGEIEFVVTQAAKEAMARYESADVTRKHESSRLSEFLDRYIKRSQRQTLRAVSRGASQEATL